MFPRGRPFRRGGYSSRGRGGGPSTSNNVNQPRRGRGGGYRGNKESRGRGNAKTSEEYKPDVIEYEKIQELCKGLDTGKILRGSNELLTAVHTEAFYNRLNDLWSEVDRQIDFLQIILAIASSCQADTMMLTHDFVTRVLDSQLIKTITEKQISPLMHNEQMRQAKEYWVLARLMVRLFNHGFAMLPSKMKSHVVTVQAVLLTLKSMTDEFLNSKCKSELERLEMALKELNDKEAAKSMKANEFRPQKEGQSFEGSVGSPPDGFRKLSVVPTAQDMNLDNATYLRASKFKGRYDDDEHYLDVQFRLLREDLIRPLREGIAAYRRGGTKETDLYVYENVKLEVAVMHKTTGQMLSYAKLNVNKRMRWNKRLTYGSLVCLSSDAFRSSFLFATVIDRDEHQLRKGKVGLKFEDMSEVNTKYKYKMVESPAFFEAYRHVMTTFQAMPENDHIPFSKFLVAAETETNTPVYLRNRRLNLKSVFNEEKTGLLFDQLYFASDIKRLLKPEHFGLDQGQFNALEYALTTNLAIIQGPPGTGKTFMGLQLVKILLSNFNDNQLERQGPILVVCYTNHALDQFLEGISKFTKDGIIRVGGRCKNEALKKFELKNFRKFRHPLNMEYALNVKEIKQLARKLEELVKEQKELETRFASPATLMPIIANSTFSHFLTSKRLSQRLSEDSSETQMYLWLTRYQPDFASADDQIPVNIPMIRVLMKWGIPEIKARNTYVKACLDGHYFDEVGLFNLSKREYAYLSSHEVIKEAQHWPSIRQVNEVMKMGYHEEVAVETLVSTALNLNAIQEEFKLVQRSNVINRLAKVTISAEALNEGLTTEEFKDEDQENRMIDDNFFEEVFKDDETKFNKKKLLGKKKSLWYDSVEIRYFFDHIIAAPPMSAEEANNVIDIWQLPLQKRWRLYQYWIDRIHENNIDRNKNLNREVEREYGRIMKRLEELRFLADVDALKAAKVIGMTTTGAAKHQRTLQSVRPRIVIVEEAAEVLEAHLVASLTLACEHLILIGDHKQLRPNPAVYELARKYNFDVSLFERLINNGYPYRMLENQHRMCVDISQPLMGHFYDGLKDDSSVLEREDVKGVTANLFFINHDHPEIVDREFKSHQNPYEVEYCVRLAKYFLQQNYEPEQVTILCTYLDQLLEMRKQAYLMLGSGIRVESVDSYQGEESDIIILSLVRSNNPQKKIGFLNIPNRVCVALSRAKMGLYVVCNMDFLADNCNLWNEIRKSVENVEAIGNELIVKCQMHGNEQAITHYDDFETKCRDGGCNVPCNARLHCGHTCVKACHVEDMNHEKQKCLKPCERKCASNYKHPCEKLCYEDCGTCQVKVLKTLPCGHEKMDKCGLKGENIVCSQPCTQILSCSHPCEAGCNQPCTQKCLVKVQKQMPGCGHVMTMRCFQKPYEIKCTHKVEKEWPRCKHKVTVKCSDDITNMPCPKPCGVALPDCEHICQGTCGSCSNGRLHQSCKEDCKKILICGHECQSKCSKTCPPCPRAYETACGHSQYKKMVLPGKHQKKSQQPKFKDKKTTGRATCGEPCPPCVEKCLNICEHRKCTLKCAEPCNVKPCSESCKKLLPCDPIMKKKMTENDENYIPHLCIGVCGDDCPKICKICDPEKFEEIKQICLGNKDNDEARLVQLKDCKCIIEVQELDKWIESCLHGTGTKAKTVAIVPITCPKCKTPICQSKRYLNVLNQRTEDINKIKGTLLGLSEVDKKKELAKFADEVNKTFNLDFLKKFAPQCAGKLSNLRNKFVKPDKNLVTKSWLTTARNILIIVEKLTKYAKKAEEMLGNIETKNITHRLYRDILIKYNILSFKSYICDQFVTIIQVLDPNSMSETAVYQATFETMRFGYIVDLFDYLTRITDESNDLPEDAARLLAKILKLLHGEHEFKDNVEKILLKNLEELLKAHPVSGFTLSNAERIQIATALSNDVRHWYKCPNGHIYGIGKYGRAVVKAKCPECNATIGGGRYTLRRAMKMFKMK